MTAFARGAVDIDRHLGAAGNSELRIHLDADTGGEDVEEASLEARGCGNAGGVAGFLLDGEFAAGGEASGDLEAVALDVVGFNNESEVVVRGGTSASRLVTTHYENRLRK